MAGISGYEARKEFHDSTRRAGRSNTPVHTHRRSGLVVLPGDRLDKRLHPDYRNGPIRVSKLTKAGMILLSRYGSMDHIPTWDEIRTMPKEEQRDLLSDLYRTRNGEEMAALLGATRATVYSRLSALGIGRNTVPYEGDNLSTMRVQPTGKVVRTMEGKVPVVADVPNPPKMALAINGEFGPAEVAKRLLAFAGLLEGTTGEEPPRYRVSLHIEEI